MLALADRDFCAALMFTLGHFLWQGTMIAVIAATIATRLRTPRTRYLVLLAAFCLMAISPVGTLAVNKLRASQSVSAPVSAEAAPLMPSFSMDVVPQPAPPSLAEVAPIEPLQFKAAARKIVTRPTKSARIPPVPVEAGWQRYAPLVTDVYGCGVAVMLFRLMVGLWGGWKLRRRSLPITEAPLLQALRRQVTSLGLQCVPVLAYCERVAVPTVIGILRPTILLPLAFTSGLTPEQLESILAHELAHVRRYDHLVNLFQRFVESLLFFHPAVWWLSNRIRIEREYCCDDLVVACGAVPLDYARSLLRVAELSRLAIQHRSISAVSLLATGQPSKLRQRIARLLGDTTNTEVRLQHRWPAVVLGLACLYVGWSTTQVGWSIADEQPHPAASRRSQDISQGPSPGVDLARQVPDVSNEGASQSVNSIIVQAEPTESTNGPAAAGYRHATTREVQALDWPQWGGNSHRNNLAAGQTVPVNWNLESRDNVKWSADLGNQTFSSPVIANNKVFIGTNNGHGYVKEHPATQDVSCLLAFDEPTGRFLWQASSLKLPEGFTQDWPQIGICSSVYCEGSSVWYVTNRAEIMCLDAEGFRDAGENDGPFQDERLKGETDADIMWSFDTRQKLNVRPYHIANCSITCLGDRLFVVLSSGVDQSGRVPTNPTGACFACFDKRTGQLLWSDNSASPHVLECQWSSPCVFEARGQQQVVMGGGDGWIYSFDPAGAEGGTARLLWKYDTNLKAAQFALGQQFTRNYCIATPVFNDGYVYIGNGRNPEQGEGPGRLHCIDPTRRGDVSPQLAVDAQGKPLAPRRLQAVDPAQGERAIPNPNSAAVWVYDSNAAPGAKPKFDESFHRTLSSVAIIDNLLFISDLSGLLHCLDAKQAVNGKPIVHWTHDLFSACWGSPLIVDGKVYIGNEDGKVTVFKASPVKTVIAEHEFDSRICSTLAAANNTLYVATQKHLFAIASPLAKEPKVSATPTVSAESTAFAAYDGAEPPSTEAAAKVASTETPDVAGEKLLEGIQQSVVSVSTERTTLVAGKPRKVHGLALGIMVDPRGYILTTDVVLQEQDAGKTRVRFHDGTTCLAALIAVDAVRGLAMLKVELKEKVPPLKLGKSAGLSVGTPVLAIIPKLAAKTPEVTGMAIVTGKLTNLHREIEINAERRYTNLLQTDAGISPGSSGGPLLNAAGEVIGVNLAIRAGSTRLGFATAIDDVRPFLEKSIPHVP